MTGAHDDPAVLAERIGPLAKSWIAVRAPAAGG